MGHTPDPAADADQLRGLIRDAHAAAKDLRAAIRDARQLGAGLTAEFEAIFNHEIRSASNHLQQQINDYVANLNAGVDAARREMAQRLFDARIEYDEKADNFTVVFAGARFDENAPAPYPETT